jgi:hypothetical protein
MSNHFANPDPARKTTVVLVDELDQMLTKRQDVLYNFFNFGDVLREPSESAGASACQRCEKAAIGSEIFMPLILENHFANPDPARKTTVVLVDELDQMLTKRQDVLYSRGIGRERRLTKTAADLAAQLALGQVHRIGDRQDDEARTQARTAFPSSPTRGRS